MKLMFNEDWIHFIWTRYERKIAINETVLREFIYQYKDTQVTDFVMNVNGTVSTYPSQTRESFCDKYLATEENDIAVNYRHTFAQKAYEIFIEKNLDMYQIWIEAAREIGIRPWISIRMNDCHGNEHDTDLRKSRYVSDHPEFWRIRHRQTDGYYDRTLDFSLKQVREDLLTYIEETVKRYRPDGLELDFTREALLFRPGYEQEGMDIVNDLLFQIKELCQEYGDIPISVLVNGGPQSCLELGVDPAHWAENRWINSVVLLPRWETINTDYEIGVWKKLLGGHASLGGGQQLLIKPEKAAKNVMSNLEMAFGQASANLYNGCDFVYLYNHMDLTESGLDSVNHSTSIRQPDNLKKILQNVGDYETASAQKRSHVLTYDDYAPYWKNTVSRLPVAFGSDIYWKSIKITTGGMRRDETACLILGFDKRLESAKMQVYVNCVKAEFAGYGGLDQNISPLFGHVFAISKESDIDGYGIIELQVCETAVLGYAEIVICKNTGPVSE